MAQVPPGRLEVDGLEYPWSAIGRVNAGGRGHCTGFLVAADRVITAAHCLYVFVEGRWRGPAELHFVAGYQRDRVVIHSAVTGYDVSRQFKPLDGPSAANALHDWAILRLAEPIGERAGWLAMKAPDSATMTALKAGRSHLIQAGYHRRAQHVMSAALDCPLTAVFNRGLGLAHACDLAEGDSGSPLLLLEGDRLSAIAIHIFGFEHDGQRMTGALSVAFFAVPGGPEAPSALFRQAGLAWQGGSAPAAGGPVRALPLATIGQLLAERGLLPPPPDGQTPQPPDPVALEAAIAAYQRQAGLAPTGEPSFALFARLVARR
ncbi:MAG: trypsin-like serine protease [Kiloniellales bacterium]